MYSLKATESGEIYLKFYFALNHVVSDEIMIVGHTQTSREIVENVENYCKIDDFNEFYNSDFYKKEFEEGLRHHVSAVVLELKKGKITQELLDDVYKSIKLWSKNLN